MIQKGRYLSQNQTERQQLTQRRFSHCIVLGVVSPASFSGANVGDVPRGTDVNTVITMTFLQCRAEHAQLRQFVKRFEGDSFHCCTVLMLVILQLVLLRKHDVINNNEKKINDQQEFLDAWCSWCLLSYQELRSQTPVFRILLDVQGAFR